MMICSVKYSLLFLAITMSVECKKKLYRRYKVSGFTRTTTPTTVGIVNKIYHRMRPSQLQEHLFLKDLVESINKAIVYLKVDKYSAGDYYSRDFLFLKGKAQNLSTLENDWRFMNSTLKSISRRKYFVVHFVVKRLLISYEVYRRNRGKNLFRVGYLTIVIPVSVFHTKLRFYGLTKSGSYVPIIDSMQFFSPYEEEVHFSLTPGERDYDTVKCYMKSKEMVERRARAHIHHEVGPYTSGMLMAICKQLFSGNIGWVPKMQHLKDYIYFETANYDNIYTELDLEPHFYKKKEQMTYPPAEIELDFMDSISHEEGKELYNLKKISKTGLPFNFGF